MVTLGLMNLVLDLGDGEAGASSSSSSESSLDDFKLSSRLRVKKLYFTAIVRKWDEKV